MPKSNFCVPMKVKSLPLRRCDECKKRKISTVFYEVHDQGLNAHVDLNVCKKCMQEAKEMSSRKKLYFRTRDISQEELFDLFERIKFWNEWKKEIDYILEAK